MKNKTLIIIIITAIILIIIAIIGKKAGWFGKAQVYEVLIEYVKRRTIIETIIANGKIQPETEVKISPDVSGEIVELPIKEGQQVKRGDLLLKIKPDIYQSGLERAEAALSTAKATLAQRKAQHINSERSYQRSKELYEKNAISKSEFETAEAEYLISKANLEASEYSIQSAEASVKEAKENLAKTIIYAPSSGTISKLNVELGERVVGTAQMSGTELLRIANLNSMIVLVEVNENDIIRVEIGDTALIEIDAYLDRQFKGIVTEIANSATITGQSSDQVTNFEVKVRILPESYADLMKKPVTINGIKYPFRPGMSATVEIQTDIKNNVLSVPIQAVTMRIDTAKKIVQTNNKKLLKNKIKKIEDDDFYEEEEKPDTTNIKKAKEIEVVFVFENNKACMREVKTGIQDDNYIEILNGLSLSDKIITGPYLIVSKKLKDGDAVKKAKKEKLSTN